MLAAHSAFSIFASPPLFWIFRCSVRQQPNWPLDDKSICCRRLPASGSRPTFSAFFLYFYDLSQQAPSNASTHPPPLPATRSFLRTAGHVKQPSPRFTGLRPPLSALSVASLLHHQPTLSHTVIALLKQAGDRICHEKCPPPLTLLKYSLRTELLSRCRAAFSPIRPDV